MQFAKGRLRKKDTLNIKDCGNYGTIYVTKSFFIEERVWPSNAAASHHSATPSFYRQQMGFGTCLRTSSKDSAM